MEMIHRNEYIDWLRQWQDKPVIKVITGVRRCGKSTLLTLFKNDLIKRGILPEQVISLNLEDLKYDYIKTYLDLNQEVEKKLCTDKMNYIFIDEVQDLAGSDLELIKLLFKTNSNTTLVGDPRQVTYLTHNEKKFWKISRW